MLRDESVGFSRVLNPSERLGWPGRLVPEVLRVKKYELQFVLGPVQKFFFRF